MDQNYYNQIRFLSGFVLTYSIRNFAFSVFLSKQLTNSSASAHVKSYKNNIQNLTNNVTETNPSHTSPVTQRDKVHS